jgi:hypothetical protein
MKDGECKDYLNRYFCDECNDEDIHDHRPSRITDVIKLNLKDWIDFLIEVGEAEYNVLNNT